MFTKITMCDIEVTKARHNHLMICDDQVPYWKDNIIGVYAFHGLVEDKVRCREEYPPYWATF